MNPAAPALFRIFKSLPKDPADAAEHSGTVFNAASRSVDMGIASGRLAGGSVPPALLGLLGFLGRRASARRGEAPSAGRFAIEGLPYQISLAHREMHRVRHEGGGTLQCLGGSVWITLDGGPAEHVIEAGQSWRLPAGAGAIAYALEPAVLRVRPATETDGGPGSAT